MATLRRRRAVEGGGDAQSVWPSCALSALAEGHRVSAPGRRRRRTRPAVARGPARPCDRGAESAGRGLTWGRSCPGAGPGPHGSAGGQVTNVLGAGPQSAWPSGRAGAGAEGAGHRPRAPAPLPSLTEPSSRCPETTGRLRCHPDPQSRPRNLFYYNFRIAQDIVSL